MKILIRTLFYTSIFVAFTEPLIAQDSITYCQTNSPWISNCYTFIQKDSIEDDAIFINNLYSDDLQEWHGTGNYRETKKRIIIYPYDLIRHELMFQGDSVVVKDDISDTTHIKKHILRKSREKLYYNSSYFERSLKTKNP
ncbi:hypothetical protein [Algoriphagus aquimarinus]|uniref:Uncharacterized protein n=1 Tax=Algoriphagus aquimarinus TaxID=237018 RepID=A0A5C7B0I3_9BACT|nr:hypothetical protein [Algoriphagus aquimarinus]TXE14636.1 hypothetical protein ESV85_03450 [Algoriphagus aquimarinus]